MKVWQKTEKLLAKIEKDNEEYIKKNRFNIKLELENLKKNITNVC